MEKRESVRVLEECIDLQNKKGADYQSDASDVKQADYYPSGVKSIYEVMNAKMLRAKSLLQNAERAEKIPNFESLEDTFKDLINYASFAVSYCRKKIDGQNPNNDIFNRPERKPEISEKPMSWLDAPVGIAYNKRDLEMAKSFDVHGHIIIPEKKRT